MQGAEVVLRGRLVRRHRHTVDSGRGPPTQSLERSCKRLDVDVVEQRRKPGLARPFGRVVHSHKVRVQRRPALRLDLPLLARGPQWLGPSLRTARFLRRH